MLDIIICDDERHIIDLIVEIIDWEQLGYRVIGTAYNGIDALKLIDTCRPAVVLTDIRMPGLTGIDLAKYCKENGIPSTFIIISGYRQFEYAHSALQYGVEHYLLKPINKDELSDTLVNIQEKLARMQDALSLKASYSDVVENYNLEIAKNLVSQYVGGYQNLTNAPDFSDLSNKLNKKYFSALYISISPSQGEKFLPTLIIDHAIEQIGHSISSSGYSFICTGLHTGVLLLLSYSDNDREMFRQRIHGLHLALLATLAPFGYNDIIIGIGNEQKDIASLPNSISNAQRIIALKLDSDAKIFECSHENSSNISITQLVGAEITAIVMAIKERNYSIISGIYNDVIGELCSHPANSALLIYDFISYLFNEIDHLKKQENTENLPEIQDLIFSWYKIFLTDCSIKDFTERILDLILSITRKFAETSVVDSVCAIRNAKEYILEHYMDEEISLNYIANLVGLSASYFSTIFKNETGINFSDFIISTRLTEAKRLLIETNLSVAVVAEKVGYRDQKYFSKIFKKVTNLKPSDFRKLYS